MNAPAFLVRSRHPLSALLTLLVGGVAVPAHAEICTLDSVPAATLLLPYFEVDLDDPGNADTTFRVRNASAAPTLAHVILWTDWGVPTLSFDLFLVGFDSQLFVLSDLLSSPGLDSVVSAHTGSPIAGLAGAGECQGKDHGDDVARGYVTIDNGGGASELNPGAPGYFDVDNRHVNALFGTATYLSGHGSESHSIHLVGIEAEEAFDGAAATGYTFYGRYTQGTGIDHREPLGSSWSIRFEDSPGTELIVWRDSTVDDVDPSSGFDCSTGPAWNPLSATEVVCFSEQNAVEVLCQGAECFPLATQRVPFGSGGLDPLFSNGRCMLNLNTSDGALPGDVDFGASGNIHQSYVLAVQRRPASSASGGGTVLTHACVDESTTVCGTSDSDGDGVPDDCDIAVAFTVTGTLDDGGDGVAVGDVIHYTYELTNTSGMELQELTLHDPTAVVISCAGGNPIPALSGGAGILCSGAYSITQADIDSGSKKNTAHAISPQIGVVVDAHVEPIPQSPALGLLKTGTVNDGGNGLAPGDLIEYTLEVSNTGNRTLTNVIVSDPLLADLTCTGGNPIPSLAPASVQICAGTHTLAQEDLDAGLRSNTANANSDQGTPISSTANTMIDAKIDLQLTLSLADEVSGSVLRAATSTATAAEALIRQDGGPDSATVVPGESYVLLLEYRNAGNRLATGVQLADAVPLGTAFAASASDPGWSCVPDGASSLCTLLVGNLAAGAGGSAMFALEVTSLASSFTNTASISDDGSNGDDALIANNLASIVVSGQPPALIPALGPVALALLVLLLGGVALFSLGRPT